MKNIYNEKLRQSAVKYLEKNVTALKEEDPSKAFKTLKKLGAHPGECLEEGSFTLTSHTEQNLTEKESVERIASHFAAISNEFPAFNEKCLPSHVQEQLKKPIDLKEIPELSDFDVYRKLRSSKKPRSCVPGDLPHRLLKEFIPELSLPANRIFNNIFRTGHWPKQWRIEYGVPLKKVPNPDNEDQLRIISLTSFLSKVCEQFVLDWLLHYVEDKLDWKQYGGVKGSSITHYLIDFVNFVLYNQDLKVPHAVIAVMFDFSKAFNRINHHIIIRILSDMGVPAWLLHIVIGFLTDRELVVRYKGYKSDRRSLPGGTPQGTKLGLFLFLILINYAGIENLENNIGSIITKPLSKRNPMKNNHMKYVDDLSFMEALNLEKCLVPNLNPILPLSFHDRTNHILPNDNTKLQTHINSLVKFTADHEMQINEQKCKVMMFNSRKKFDATPNLLIDDTKLELVEVYKLLGIQIRSDLSWVDNTDYICRKAYTRLWILRRLKLIGAATDEMMEVYQKQVRPVLELAVPVWHHSLTQYEITQIERVQKCALHIILGSSYSSYENALLSCSIESLAERRQSICVKFAKKSIKSNRFEHWYVPNNENVNMRKTRGVKTKLKPVQTRTLRYEKSPIPALTDILNSL